LSSANKAVVKITDGNTGKEIFTVTQTNPYSSLQKMVYIVFDNRLENAASVLPSIDKSTLPDGLSKDDVTFGWVGGESGKMSTFTINCTIIMANVAFSLLPPKRPSDATNKWIPWINDFYCYNNTNMTVYTRDNEDAPLSLISKKYGLFGYQTGVTAPATEVLDAQCGPASVYVQAFKRYEVDIRTRTRVPDNVIQPDRLKNILKDDNTVHIPDQDSNYIWPKNGGFVRTVNTQETDLSKKTTLTHTFPDVYNDLTVELSNIETSVTGFTLILQPGTGPLRKILTNISQVVEPENYWWMVYSNMSDLVYSFEADTKDAAQNKIPAKLTITSATSPSSGTLRIYFYKLVDIDKSDNTMYFKWFFNHLWFNHAMGLDDKNPVKRSDGGWTLYGDNATGVMLFPYMKYIGDNKAAESTKNVGNAVDAGTNDYKTTDFSSRMTPTQKPFIVPHTRYPINNKKNINAASLYVCQPQAMNILPNVYGSFKALKYNITTPPKIEIWMVNEVNANSNEGGLLGLKQGTINIFTDVFKVILKYYENSDWDSKTLKNINITGNEFEPKSEKQQFTFGYNVVHAWDGGTQQKIVKGRLWNYDDPAAPTPAPAPATPVIITADEVANSNIIDDQVESFLNRNSTSTT
jgi:hypothetical protein